MIKFKTIPFPKVNKVIVYLTTSDVFNWALMAVMNGFVGLYLATKLETDVIRIVGIGYGILSLSQGLVQIPTGYFIDRTKSDRDDIFMLLFGDILMGAPFLLYPTITSEYHFFMLQFIIGFGAGINLVSWRKMFAKNLDKDKEGMEYGMYETIMAFCIAFFSLVAGIIANISETYFDIVMAGIGVIMLSSGLWAILLLKLEKEKNG
ncbi:MFS transporter [Candidatus Dojkabacteria bacterium]|uniref:MFS transporter n=1 Tax=Candidatus Dojkabacteria bacterium TaxID=2099670 RepID=A0A955L233_9BACT|nr:MFS transporter [Candidatus Dojkabacteria bacterium]